MKGPRWQVSRSSGGSPRGPAGRLRLGPSSLTRLSLLVLAACATAPAPRPEPVAPPAPVEPKCPTTPPPTAGAPRDVLGSTIAMVCLVGASEDAYLRLHELVAPQEGQRLAAESVRETLEALYGLGLVRDAAAVAEPLGDGRVVLSYVVSEYPFIRRVTFEGAKSIVPRDLEEVASPGNRASPLELKRLERAVTKAYVEQGFKAVSVERKGVEDVVLHIDEGPRSVVKAIRFPGAKTVAEGELLKALKSMVGLPFREDRLEADALAVSQVYYDHGMVNVSVEPAFGPLQAPGATELVFTIAEGPIFKVGKLTVSGVPLGPEKQLMRGFESKAGSVFSRSALKRDIERLRDRAKEHGVTVEVTPITNIDTDKKLIDVDLSLERRDGRIEF